MSLRADIRGLKRKLAPPITTIMNVADAMAVEAGLSLPMAVRRDVRVDPALLKFIEEVEAKIARDQAMTPEERQAESEAYWEARGVPRSRR